MADLLNFYQFRKIDGKTVKVPPGFVRLLQKHHKDFHLIHKEINNAVKLLARIYDDSQRMCLKEGIELQPKRIWIGNVLAALLQERLAGID